MCRKIVFVRLKRIHMDQRFDLVDLLSKFKDSAISTVITNVTNKNNKKVRDHLAVIKAQTEATK